VEGGKTRYTGDVVECEASESIFAFSKFIMSKSDGGDLLFDGRETR
jgi:hypothetical protein